MKFKIDHNSNIPLYKQIVANVKEDIKKGTLASGATMPSLSEFARANNISMETTKKAYNILKNEGLMSGHQGKGYYIDIRNSNAPLRILMLVDKLSAYKLAIHKGLVEALQHPADITINIHNQDIEMFDKMVTDTAEDYDYYLVAAHFPAEVKSSRVAKILKRIPNNKLILIDKDIPEIKGHIGRVYQDFTNDAAQSLHEAISLVRKYRNVTVISSESSLYGGIIGPSIMRMLKKEKITCSLEQTFKPELMTLGTLFIVLCGQLDTDHFTTIREALSRGYVLGRDIGLISYNDEPVNEFICGGLSCLSSDFYQMGLEAALMINEGRMHSIHSPFRLTKRATL